MADDCSCECVWTHEMAIRRLLSLIRQSQSSCTDTECIDLPSSLPSPTGGEETSFTMMTMFMILAVILYFIRPDSIIKVVNSKKPGDRPSGGRDPPSGDAPPAVN
ncbi:small integral membrane protein 14 [Episyrphus balteatus]|uniref:small integral membrane protein 14 n=1 Tax=Episyrphus balteatus TaxID=286459 RepID=UPI002486AC16|nr:small integral membrane protein 14 [Episyrphus balteatus]XP_055837503.1 small integral membrane protein 14 [Episyrphus balteatus]XP_055837504.1 small integral membrane protein 14 [Episyrphus balteatus]XP_055837505.1 small integral membrane protein 14 [Episyrphus balteatus]